ncbi:Prefoldin beta-like protein [Cystobasidium minutum MCA 4210]|uniref:Prefoldin beta-like protein n=1 Tax=Cystobasidium minutum MCA 4210 TaxID=1397322 RepID=UPI0034CE0717|eukprot:jgi/Rhomi1/195019/gm1.3233_g
MSSSKPAVPQSRPSDAALTQEYNRRRTELSEIINKVSELERDADEHTLVLETLRQVNEEDPDRKCFRMIGGILVQKTVKDILPQLQTNYQGVQSVIEQLSVTYKKREQEFEEFQKKNNIVVQRAP